MYVVGGLIVAGAFLAGAAAAWLWHRYVAPHWSCESVPVVAAACGAVASFYVLTIAFLIVSASTSLGAARTSAVAEAGAVRDAYMAAQSLSPEQRKPIQNALRAYTRTVADVEWPELAHRQAAPSAWNRLDALPPLVDSTKGGSTAAQADLHSSLHEIFVQRRLRLATSREGVAPVLLAFLTVAAVVTPAFFLLMGWPSGSRAMVGLGVLAALFAAGIWLVTELNHPFSNGIRVGPEAFHDALLRMTHLDARPGGLE